MRQVEAYLKGMGMKGLASVWVIDGGLSEGFKLEGPGVCIDDGQTEA